MYLVKLRLFIFASLITLIYIAINLLPELPLSLFPQSSRPYIRVNVEYDMEVTAFKALIGNKMERSFRNIENTISVKGTYSPNRALYIIEFDWGSSSVQAFQNVSSIAAAYQSQLPKNTPPIRTSYYDAGLELYIVVVPHTMSAKALSEKLEARLTPILNNIQGVSASRISLVDDEEVIINVDPYRLVSLNIPLSDVIERIKAAEFDTNLGTVQGTADLPEYKVVLNKPKTTLEDIGELAIASENDRIIRLRDIADIRLQIREQDRVYQIGNQRAVAVVAWPFPDSDIYAVSKAFENELRKEVGNLGEIVTINTPIQYIDTSLNNMAIAVALGMVFAAFTVLIAYRSLGISTLIILVMPLSIALSIGFLYLLGVGVNIISIGAVGVAIGMVVDASIFVLTKTRQHLMHLDTDTIQAQRNAIIQAATESTNVVISSNLTSIAVFFPLVFTQPIVKALVSDFAIVIILLLSSSIVIALLILPTMLILITNLLRSSHWIVKRRISKKESKPSVFTTILSYSIRKKRIWFLFVTVTFGLTTHTISLLNSEVDKEIIAQPQPNIIDIGFTFYSTDFSYEDKVKLISPLHEQINSTFQDKLKFIFSDYRDDVVYLSLHVKKTTNVEQLISQLKGIVPESNLYAIDISPWVSASVRIDNLPDYRLFISGPNHELRLETMQSLASRIKENNNVLRVKSAPKTNTTDYLTIQLRNEVLEHIKLDMSYAELEKHISKYVKYATKPELLYNTELSMGDFPVKVYFGKDRIRTADALESLPIRINQQIYNLGQLATINRQVERKQFFSMNEVDTYMVEIWLKNEHSLEIDELRNFLSPVNTDDRTDISIVSSSGEIKKNIKSLITALYAAIVLVCLIVLFDLKELSDTLIMLLSIPCGFIGAVYALYFFDSTLSVNSLIGLIMLAGLGVNNSIYILHAYKDKLSQDNKISISDAVINAVHTRIGPILISSATSFFAMLPLALGLDSNGPLIQPLGLAMTGGILSLTLFSLSFIPMLLYIVESVKHRASLAAHPGRHDLE